MKSATTNRHGSAVVTLPSDTEILIVRAFDAPAALLFKAHTTPELVKQWWGYDSFDWKVCDIDLCVGGAWRWVAGHDGFDVAFHGVYKQIDGPKRLVYTEVFEGAPNYDPADEGTLNTIDFDEVDGVTTLTMLTECYTQEIRDIIIASGMEGGMQVSMDRMEDLVLK